MLWVVTPPGCWRMGCPGRQRPVCARVRVAGRCCADPCRTYRQTAPACCRWPQGAQQGFSLGVAGGPFGKGFFGDGIGRVVAAHHQLGVGLAGQAEASNAIMMRLRSLGSRSSVGRPFWFLRRRYTSSKAWCTCSGPWLPQAGLTGHGAFRQRPRPAGSRWNGCGCPAPP